MNLILFILLILVIFGGGVGYRTLGPGGGFGVGGLFLAILIVYLLFGRKGDL